MTNIRLRLPLSDTLAGEARLLSTCIDRWRCDLPREFAEAMYARAARLAELAEVARSQEAQSRCADEILDGLVEQSRIVTLAGGNVVPLDAARRRVRIAERT
jgi:hypothetical protein